MGDIQTLTATAESTTTSRGEDSATLGDLFAAVAELAAWGGGAAAEGGGRFRHGPASEVRRGSLEAREQAEEAAERIVSVDDLGEEELYGASEALLEKVTRLLVDVAHYDEGTPAAGWLRKPAVAPARHLFQEEICMCF